MTGATAVDHASFVAMGAATVLVSAMLTALAIGYARRRRLLDLPGQRRSHGVPTPRGGGIGIVVAVLLALLVSPFLGVSPPSPPLTCLVAAIALVGLVGWIDDHGGLAARWRFAAHCVAALLIGVPLVRYASASGMLPIAGPMFGTALVVWIATSTLATVWSINLHNFMDGIDGILAAQAIFVCASLAWLCASAGASIPAFWIGLFAAATLGFLPFNFPRARVFMGDVGSGVLGLLVALAVLWQMTVPTLAWSSGLILCSAFVTDATCTLLSRMWRGRRWYSAHREHAYQWMVRGGRSHAAVVAMYVGWNLSVVLPVVYWMNRMPRADHAGATSPGVAGAALVGVYALAAGLWVAAKRASLRSARQRRSHAA